MAVMDASVSHLSEVNGGDKIIRAPFTVHRCHLDQSVINCPSIQRPVFFTQHLHTGTELTGRVYRFPFSF